MSRWSAAASWCRSASKACAALATSSREEVDALQTSRARGRSRAGLLDGASVTFLAPLDPLAWDRDLLRSLFDFDYVWEVYVPRAKRRWGYYVLPLLWGDRLVGRIEPRFDRASGVVRILGIWWQDGFSPRGEPAFVEAMRAALAAYARFGGAAAHRLGRQHAANGASSECGRNALDVDVASLVLRR